MDKQVFSYRRPGQTAACLCLVAIFPFVWFTGGDRSFLDPETENIPAGNWPIVIALFSLFAIIGLHALGSFFFARVEIDENENFVAYNLFNQARNLGHVKDLNVEIKNEQKYVRVQSQYGKVNIDDDISKFESLVALLRKSDHRLSRRLPHEYRYQSPPIFTRQTIRVIGVILVVFLLWCFDYLSRYRLLNIATVVGVFTVLLVCYGLLSSMRRRANSCVLLGPDELVYIDDRNRERLRCALDDILFYRQDSSSNSVIVYTTKGRTVLSNYATARTDFIKVLSQLLSENTNRSSGNS